MSGHGGARGGWPSLLIQKRARGTEATARTLATAGIDALPEVSNPGFRHFIRSPGPEQRFKVCGSPFDPFDDKQLATAQDLMRKLANLIAVTFPPQGKDEKGLDRRFNQGLPSGFTYFLQLIAHDMVHSSLSLSRSEARTAGFANLRRMPLRLETIYGGGPGQCPAVFEPAKKGGPRTLMRLGTAQGDNSGRLREIARGRSASLPKCTGGYPEAFIADPRNDMHAIVSQMVVLFHHLHNAIVERLENDANLPKFQNDFAREHLMFLTAQSACILIFRNLIREDLLPRLIHPQVYKAYANGTVPLLDDNKALDQGEWLAPLEFTHGVMRFGHAMIRSKYSFNRLSAFAKRPADPDTAFDISEILTFNSDARAADMPLRNEWTVDWQRFFGTDIATGNFSVRIGPWSESSLDVAVKAEPPEGAGTLVYRDFLSSIMARPWSLASLLDEMRATHADLLRLSPLTAGVAGTRPWINAMKAWMNEQAKSVAEPPDGNEIAALADDPPLPFFIRFEAGGAPGATGERLGIFGSILTADVFYSALKQDDILKIDQLKTLDVQLKTLSGTLLGEGSSSLAFLSDVRSFERLISFLGDRIAFPAAETN